MLSILAIDFSLLFLLLGLNCSPTLAAKFPFNVRTKSSIFDNHLYNRASISGQNTDANTTTIPVHNTRNAEYISNITLGGRTIPVLLDTGSSDLWVTGDIPNAKDMGKAVSLSYAVGTAAGDISTADLQFDDYTVKDQAFLLVKNTSTFSIDIKAQGFEGLIGLGPNTGSTIRDKIGSGSADSVLSRVFSQNTTSANYLTILLDRSGDPSDPFTGQLTISELVPGFENITSQPKLTVDKVHKLTDADQHWQTFTDDFGVIGPDGEAIKVDSIVPKSPNNQLVVVFDSGYTLPQVPRAMSDAIYGRVQGAEYNEASGVWTVPCTQLINLSFKFGGIEFPIHPLDVSSSDFNMVNSLGNPVCVGTFQPITSAFSLLGEYDIILGMGFMRNVYTLMDYGDWIDNSSVDRGDPYVQLLSVTNKTSAHDDFVKVRLGGVDTTGAASQALLPADQMKHSPISSSEKKKMYEEMILSRWPYIFVGCLAFVIIVIGLIVWRCCVARKRRNAKKAAIKMGIASPKQGQTTYTPLQDASTPVHLKTLSGKYDYDDDPYAYSPRKEGV